MLKKLGMKAMLVLMGIGLFAGVNAQTATVGNLSGTVRDPSGAAVPKADVEIKEESTGADAYRACKRRWILPVYEFAGRAIHGKHGSPGLQAHGCQRRRSARG